MVVIQHNRESYVWGLDLSGTTQGILSVTNHFLRGSRPNKMKKLLRIFSFASLVALVLWCMFFSYMPSAQKRNKGTMKTTRERLHILLDACERFKTDCGRYPLETEKLNVLNINLSIIGWKGPYLKTVPADGWGNSFYYSLDCNAKPVITSAGPDGVLHTSDDMSNEE